MFADESKFNVFESVGRKMARCEANQEVGIKVLKPTMKYDSGSLVIWVCISTPGVNELIFIDRTLDTGKQNKIEQKVSTTST